MRKISEFTVAEQVTSIMAVLVMLAVAFGFVVSGERNDMVELAEASLAEAKARAAAATSKGQPIACDDSLVSPEVLRNAFIPLSIRPIAVDLSERPRRYVPGIRVHSKQEEDGNDTFVSVERLYESLKEAGEYSISRYIKEEKEVEYSILLSDTAVCTAPKNNDQKERFGVDEASTVQIETKSSGGRLDQSASHVVQSIARPG